MASLPRGSFTPSRRLQGVLCGLAAAGLLTLLAGAAAAPHRAFPNLLQAAWFLTLAGVFGVFFVALNAVTRGVWFAPLRRVAEALAALLPFAAGATALALLGLHHLYEWSHADAVAADPLLQAKAGWLNAPFFLGRVALYFALWILFARLLLSHSRRQDADGDPAHAARVRKLSGGFLVVMALTLSFASFDLVMSLEPHWFSTIFGVYHFARMFESGVAVLIVACLLLRRWGPFREIFTKQHQHDLGKYLFAFSIFWMYIWFSQYMLIWYSHIPEEISWYLHRHKTPWAAVSIANIVLNWGIPFFTLLSIPAKRSDRILAAVAGVALVGHWVDLTFLIQPTFHREGPVFGVFEAAALMFAFSALFLLLLRGLARHPLVPQKDPEVEAGLHPGH